LILEIGMQNIRFSTFSELRSVRLLRTVSPAPENMRSHGTDVATKQRRLISYLYWCGYCDFRWSYHTNGSSFLL